MGQQTVNELLALDELRSWAADLPEGTKVGVPESNEYCPIARYLDENTGERWSVADGQVSRLYGNGTSEYSPSLLPDWARRIVHLVDALPGIFVKREQFLRILDQIAEEG